MNIIRIIRTECQNQDFSHPNCIWSGLGIFKQNSENPNKIGMVGQSEFYRK